MFIIIFLRLLIPTLILRYPLFGGFIALLADYLDLDILMLIDHSQLDLYQQIDKTLDLYYLGLEAYMVLTWSNKIVRQTALALFGWRLLGILIFEFSPDKIYLLIFPNLFEIFYLLYLFHLALWKRDLLTTWPRTLGFVLILLFPKLLHEYYLHINIAWMNDPYLKRLLDKN